MSLCTSLKNFFKRNTTRIDNCVFRLHYQVTTVILLAFSILVLCRQYFGDAINCISKDDIPTNLLDSFCLIHATFSLPDAWEKKVGQEIPYPGIDKYRSDEERVYHTYYQWVWIVLLLQAILFYIPRCFWKAMEDGRIRSLVLGMNSPILPEETNYNNRRLLVNYLKSNMNNHRIYFVSYVIAEVMNFLNIVGQIFMVNAFLGGEFLTFGLKVMEFKGWKFSVGYDPMVKVFPRLTKCTFHRYGSSGDVQKHDAICNLPMNILNEKIYLFMWFWFALLVMLSGTVLVYRALIVFWPRFRLRVSRYRTRFVNQDYLETIINKYEIGDWLILDLLSKNLDSLNFRDVINDLAEKGDDHELKGISSCNL